MGDMPTEADFIRAVLDRPDDDAPRLVYADWLDEQGQDERAEFIRVQCRIAELQTRGVAVAIRSNYPALLRRERELLASHEKTWAHQGLICFGAYGERGWEYVPGAIRDNDRDSLRWAWRRGFIEAVILSADEWLRNADAILQAQPVREVTLTTLPQWDVDTPDEGGMRIRLRGRLWHSSDAAREGILRLGTRGTQLWLLRAEWPSVKTWNLPPRPSFREMANAIGLEGAMRDQSLRNLGGARQ